MPGQVVERFIRYLVMSSKSLGQSCFEPYDRVQTSTKVLEDITNNFSSENDDLHEIRCCPASSKQRWCH
jgi:hypothetical protein